MNENTGAPEGQHLLMLCSGEISKTEMMYIQYPEGYDQSVAEKNSCIYADIVPREFLVATTTAARIQVNIGLAQAMARAYFAPGLSWVPAVEAKMM